MIFWTLLHDCRSLSLNSQLWSGIPRLIPDGTICLALGHTHWNRAHTHTLQSRVVWALPNTCPSTWLFACGLRPNSCLSERTSIVPGALLGLVASIISLNGESTYFHCHLAHICQLTFFDYQGIYIIHALPASLLWVIESRALSYSATCTKPAVRAHSDSHSFCEIFVK